jgi:hypothetical protein
MKIKVSEAASRLMNSWLIPMLRMLKYPESELISVCKFARPVIFVLYPDLLKLMPYLLKQVSRIGLAAMLFFFVFIASSAAQCLCPGQPCPNPDCAPIPICPPEDCVGVVTGVPIDGGTFALLFMGAALGITAMIRAKRR